MRLRYTTDALTHLEAINNFLNERNPAAARRVAADIRMAAERLCDSRILAVSMKRPERVNGLCEARHTSSCTKWMKRTTQSL